MPEILYWNFWLFLPFFYFETFIYPICFIIVIMNEIEKWIIKKLAKESLENKWYPIAKELKNAPNIEAHCAFCHFIDEVGSSCPTCYIERLIPDFCVDIMDKYSIVDVLGY